MKPTVYIETTIVSYLTARPSRDVVMAGHQRATLDWWDNHRDRFELLTSELTHVEASAGDATAAAARTAALQNIPVLLGSDAAADLADRLLAERAIPPGVRSDAVHVAICALNDVDILLTWNFKHLANPWALGRIEEICRQAGYRTPQICTPYVLIEDVP